MFAAFHKKQGKKHTSRGQYKAQVLSKYHRPTQNRNQYILNNSIKSTIILNRWQQQVQGSFITTQAHLWGLKPPHHTHLGIRFFKPEYIRIIQDSFSLFFLCRNVTLRSSTTMYRNVTLRSSTILVSERDTPIPYYPGVGTWHSDPLLSWCRNVILDPYYPGVERDTRSILSWCRNVTPDPYYPGVGTWHPIHTILVSKRDTRSILSWCRNVTPDPYNPGVGTWHLIHTILVSECDTPIP